MWLFRKKSFFSLFCFWIIATPFLLTGCGNLQITPGDLTTSALNALPKAELSLPSAVKRPVGSPTEVYTRVARGVLSCWFGSHGPLKTTHRFHAQAEPRSKGGNSRITLYEIPKDRTRKLGDRAFSISITRDGTRAHVETENSRLSKRQANQFTKDVERWAAAQTGCLTPEEVAKDWSAETQTSNAPNKK